jgi:hypothetical protein
VTEEIARNQILDAFMTELWNITYNQAKPKCVTRNMRRSEEQGIIPAIFLISSDDDAIQFPNRGKDATQTYTQDWEMGISFFIEGTNAEKAPKEIEEYRVLVEAAVKKAADNIRIGLLRKNIQGPMFPETESKAIGMTVWFRVIYTEGIE